MNAKICRKLLHRHHMAQTVLAFRQLNLSLAAFLRTLTVHSRSALRSQIFWPFSSGHSFSHCSFVASDCVVVRIEFHQKEQILRCVRTFRRFGEKYRNSGRGGPWLRGFCSANADYRRCHENQRGRAHTDAASMGIPRSYTNGSNEWGSLRHRCWGRRLP